MKKLDKMARILNDEFRDRLAEAVREQYGVEIRTEYHFLTGEIVSTRADGEPFTPEQHAYLDVFEAGYLAALQRVRKEARA